MNKWNMQKIKIYDGRKVTNRLKRLIILNKYRYDIDKSTEKKI